MDEQIQATPVEQNPMSQSPKHHNNLALLLVLVIAVGGIVLYVKPSALQNLSQKSSQPNQASFTPLPFLSNCGVSDTFLSNANSNPFVLDARLSGSLKGIIKTLFKDAIELTIAGGNPQTLKIPLMGKNGTLAQTDRIVYMQGTNAPVAINSLREGQTVQVAFICRPKVEKFSFVSPHFEVVNILVTK